MQSVSKYFASYSPLHALDAERLKREQEQYKSLSSTQKAILGASVALERFPAALCYVGAFACAREVMWKNKCVRQGGTWQKKIEKILELPRSRLTPIQYHLFLCSVLIGLAIPEELLFRGCLQNGLERMSPGPYAILGANVPFALAHIPFGMGGQVFHLGLAPKESILYHTTGGLIAPVSCHLTNTATAISTVVFLLIAANSSKKPFLPILAMSSCVFLSSYGIGTAGLRYIDRQTSPSAP